MFFKQKFIGVLLLAFSVLFFTTSHLVFAVADTTPADDIQRAYDACLGERKSDSLKQQACAEKLLSDDGKASVALKTIQEAYEECRTLKDSQRANYKDAECKTKFGGTEAELEARLRAVNQEISKLRTVLATTEKVYLGGDPNKSGEGYLIVNGQKFFRSIPELIGAVIDFLIKLVGTLALVLIVVSGFRLVVSAGNDNAITKSKDMLKFAIIGLVVSLLAYVIVAAIRGLVYR